MDKQPVGQLPDLTSSSVNDEIMVITNDEYNQLKKEKISDFITDLTSTDENNAIVKGTDGKLFTKDFGNASNITEGTLPVEVLPPITTDMLPASGVTEGSYRYPSSVTVNEKGQVTEIVEGQGGGGTGSDVDNRYTNGVMTYDHSDIGFKNSASKTFISVNGDPNFSFLPNYVLSNWAGRYLSIPPFNPSGSSSFSLNSHFITPESLTVEAVDRLFYLLESNENARSVQIALLQPINADYIVLRAYISKADGDLDLIGQTHLSLNTEYWARLVYDNTSGYKLEYSLNNSQWTTEVSNPSTTPPTLINPVYSSVGLMTNAFNPNVKVYIKDAYITQNGETIWNWRDDDYLIINNGATMSGQPDDIISEFSSENYAVLNRTFPTSANVELWGAFNVTSIVGTQVIFGIPNYENSISLINGKLALVYNGNTLLGDTIVELNTLYQFKLTWNNGVYTLQLRKVDDVDFTTEVTFTSNISYFGGKTIALGWGGVNYPQSYLKGYIALGYISMASEGYNYWNYYFPTNMMAAVLNLDSELEGNFPNGRNPDNTLNNIVQEAQLNNLVVYNPVNGEKAILVNDKNELFLPPQYSYVEKLNPDEDGVLNEIRYSIAENQHYIYKNVELNFINMDVVVNNGIVSCFGPDRYFGLPSTYSLGDEFNISLAVTNDADITTKQTLLSSDGINAVVENGNLSVSFRRSDVTKVQRVTTMGTSYQVTSTSTGTTGYVKTAGEASAAVASGLDLYNDVQCTQLIGTTDSTYTYTGSTGSITQTETGYVEFGGVGTVANGTNVYNDANLTDLAGQATGADWVFTDDTEESIICTLSSALTASASQTIKLSAVDGTYSLQIDENTAVTYENTSALISNIEIHIGSDGTTFYKGSVDLNTSEFSMWAFNGISAINPNINIFGNPTINGSIVSGFSLNNYILTPALSYGSSPWEVVVKIRTNDLTDVIHPQDIIGDVTNYGYFVTIGFDNVYGRPYFYFYALPNASNNNWKYIGVQGQNILQPNTDYYVKISYTGTSYILSFSLTGESSSYITDVTINDAQAITSSQIILGTVFPAGSPDNVYDGSIDLNGVSVKSNGAYIWRWNGLSENTSQWQKEALAKIGHVVDDGRYITEVEFDKPITFVTNVWLEEILKQTESPIGQPVITLSNSLASNEIWLEGATVSRTTYSKLFEIYGTTYGVGDGSTTFTLPNFIGRAIWGSQGFGYLNAGLPNITGGRVLFSNTADPNPFGVFYGARWDVSAYAQFPSNGRSYATYGADFSAASSNGLYGASSTVQPPAIQVRVKTRYK